MTGFQAQSGFRAENDPQVEGGVLQAQNAVQSGTGLRAENGFQMEGGVKAEPLLAISFGPTEIAVVVDILMLVFGAKKLPLLARGLGAGIRNFKGALSAPAEEPERASDEEADRDLR